MPNTSRTASTVAPSATADAPDRQCQCWFWCHAWSAWAQPFGFGYDAYQRRTCVVCGVVTQRKVGWATPHELAQEKG